MRILEVFFDYACPFCLRGHELLLELLPEHPDLELVWRPCESHPRPDSYGPYSDLLIQAMFFAQERGVYLWEFHKLAYRAALQDRIAIEHIPTLTRYLSGLLSLEDLTKALQTGVYQDLLQQSNQYAFGPSGVWVVPAYRMGGRKLDAVENTGVTSAQLQSFLRK